MGCTHDCESCGSNCNSAEENVIPTEKLNDYSSVKKVIGIVSGKGGVGKSFVTSMLAIEMSRRGHHTAILDADITGPSIPKEFGLNKKVTGTENGILPAQTRGGIEVMSINLLLEKDTDPVIWRGPVIAGTVKQFWTDVIWDDIDYMFVDMPPGTGDVPLTVFQSLPVDGIVIVTSPQDLVSMVVGKAINMAKMMNVPIVGIVENYSYLECPDCGKRINVFGESKIDEVAEKYGIEVLDKLPISPEYALKCDEGKIESLQTDIVKNAADRIENI